jgi:hypothetical protein
MRLSEAQRELRRADPGALAALRFRLDAILSDTLDQLARVHTSSICARSMGVTLWSVPPTAQQQRVKPSLGEVPVSDSDYDRKRDLECLRLASDLNATRGRNSQPALEGALAPDGKDMVG